MLKEIGAELKKLPYLLLYFLSLSIVSIEMLQAMVFFKGAESLLNDKVSVDMDEIIFSLFSLLILYYFLNITFYDLVQKISYKREVGLLENELSKSGFRHYYELINSFYIKLPFEILQRGGLGYFGSLYMVLARITVIIFSLLFLLFESKSLLIFIVAISVPVVFSSALLFFLQKGVGKKITGVSLNMLKSVTEKTFRMTVLNENFKMVFPTYHELIHLNSKTQTLSSFSKPLSEVSILLSALFVAMFLSDPFEGIGAVVVAVVYRLYGNSVAVISLLSLFFSARESVLVKEKAEQRDFLKSDLKINSDRVIDNLLNYLECQDAFGCEIRGESGKGKTTALEKIFKGLKEHDKAFYYASNISVKDLSVFEFFEMVGIDLKLLSEINKYDILVNVKLNTKLSSLSLGQINSFIIVSSVLSDKKYIFLDEPFANIDDYNRSLMRGLIEKCCENKCIIITNHEETLDGFQVEVLH